ncbi:MAG: YbhB/YbcL family Raf kinase inhibitor-like protein [Methylococcaceae bacterium]|jgi:Raf kinase inhibitor-like YbhB/YbcL family protein
MNKMRLLSALVLLVGASNLQAGPARFQLTSPAFEDQANVPIEYTCYGSSQSPPLVWSSVPAGTRSIALVVTDPDAPYGEGHAGNGTFFHWGIYNLPPAMAGLAEDASDDLPDAVRTSVNDTEIIGYAPICPPAGSHRYRFTIYALDQSLNLDDQIQTKDLSQFLENLGNRSAIRLLGKAMLTGRYSH